MSQLHIPAIDTAWENNNAENSTMSDVVAYLNDVIIYYGPACEWCVHYDDPFCNKKHRLRKYSMKLGPYEMLSFKMHCSDFYGKAKTKDENIPGERQLVCNALDCFIQQYCNQ